MPSRRGQAVYKRNVRRIRTICENAEHFLASFFQLSGGASPSLTGYARILQHALEMPKWELPKKFPFWHGLNVKGELPSPLHNPPMRVYALPHKFVYSLRAVCFHTARLGVTSHDHHEISHKNSVLFNLSHRMI